MPKDNDATIARWTCTPHYPCNRWLHCDHCTRRRQARAADIAERIEAAFGPLQYAVITPDENTGAAIARAKRRAIRSLGSPAALWTIEVGQVSGRLHINLLGRLDGLENVSASATWIDIRPAQARPVAAYITKRTSAPSREFYEGRLYGHSGHIGEWLLKAQELPLLQAAQFLNVIERAHEFRTKTGSLDKAGQEALRAMADHLYTTMARAVNSR